MIRSGLGSIRAMASISAAGRFRNPLRNGVTGGRLKARSSAGAARGQNCRARCMPAAESAMRPAVRPRRFDRDPFHAMAEERRASQCVRTTAGYPKHAKPVDLEGIGQDVDIARPGGDGRRDGRCRSSPVPRPIHRDDPDACIPRGVIEQTGFQSRSGPAVKIKDRFAAWRAEFGEAEETTGSKRRTW